MELSTVDGLLTLKLGLVESTALAVLLLLWGYAVRRKVKVFERFCIPAPVIGGLAFSIVALLLRQSHLLAFKLDTTVQSPFMIAFFTTVGLGGSFSLLKKGGVGLIIYWLAAGFIAWSQNGLGVLLAKLTGVHPLYGVICGAITMEGGHGSAAAFGPVIEGLGIKGATTVGMAAATFGLISGGLLGGPVTKYLIEKHNLENKQSGEAYVSLAEARGITKEEPISGNRVMQTLGIILVAMTVGAIASKWIESTFKLVLPGYVGAMFVAVILRNLNDHFRLVRIHEQSVDMIGDVTLGIFLSMALMTLKLWELFDLAIPMLVILIGQVVWMAVFTIFILFPLLGRDYDAAVMCAGMCGHGLGATPNAVANMSAVTEKYGPSTKAFLIVPLVGAFLIDLFGIPSILTFINIFK
ncbi:sodium/glutamate symporter [Gelria sp. Kuro-4]|uniref:sodium/glutamate symporter n=1 Tax=Gelria sp. Kuro-4 TaxID=2796927 RepID=UPI001BF15EAA|nr:sodium/glutamate symporter [Gelria sp. Kuro-4]MDI3522831.1 glutamate:Na+ symporter, family [Bacillota bacterium]BCV24072.1 glutamate/sodium ion symporter GltS [Gelria sp. Kuro-4]